MKLYEFAEKAFALEARGKRIARLFIGESERQTPREIIEAGVAALRAGKTRYVSFQGDERLRKKIAEANNANPENVVIAPGSKFAVFAAVKTLCEPGDNACILSPHWPGFDAICESLGVKVNPVKSSLEEKWQPSAEKLEQAIDSRTRLLIACNPNNPTSTVIEEKRLHEVIEAANARGVPVLVDGAYTGLTFKEMRLELNALDARNLFTGSFSKSFAMTGWRVGYLIAEDALVNKVVSLAQSTFSCVPQFVQEAALTALEHPEIEKRMAEVYEKRAKLAREILRGAFEFVEPQAGFYVFAGRHGLDSDSFCLRLLEKGIGVAPGSAFGYNEFVRISLTQEEHELEKSLRAIVEEAK